MNILQLHSYIVIIFIFYILFDRLFLRNFIKESIRELFYKRVRFPILIIAIGSIITGIIISSNTVFSMLLFSKISFAVLFIGSFFYCPFFMKKNKKEVKRVIYRYLVVFFLIITVALGLYI